MVPETGVGADHNWPQRMTMTTTNVEILRQGWLDAASALAPGLDTLPEFLEHGLEAAVIDERLDEQSLLRVVTEVTSAAADSLPAEELYFLTRRLQRAVYEYLLSLDALPEPPARRDGSNGTSAQDTTLIGAEEVAALGRNGHTKTVAEPVHAPKATPKPAPEAKPEPAATPVAQTVPEPIVEAQPDPVATAAAADRVEAGLAELELASVPRGLLPTPNQRSKRPNQRRNRCRPAPRSRSSVATARPRPRPSAMRAPPPRWSLPLLPRTASGPPSMRRPRPTAPAPTRLRLLRTPNRSSSRRTASTSVISLISPWFSVRKPPQRSRRPRRLPRSSTRSPSSRHLNSPHPSQSLSPKSLPHSPHAKRQAAQPPEAGAFGTTRPTRPTT